VPRPVGTSFDEETEKQCRVTWLRLTFSARLLDSDERNPDSYEPSQALISAFADKSAQYLRRYTWDYSGLCSNAANFLRFP
jgi:hypothetical protein